MQVLLFDTPALQSQGLQHFEKVDEDTLYVFPLVEEGSRFHSRNVPEPFSIAFLSIDFIVIEILTVIPEQGAATAPRGTAMAVEGLSETLEKSGFKPGAQVSF